MIIPNSEHISSQI